MDGGRSSSGQGQPEAGDGVAATLQPHNIEAEQALIGALLLNNDVFDRVSNIIEPGHFYDPVHRRIWECAAKRIQNQALASPVTLKPFLEEDPGLKELGGTEYLARLASAAVSIMAAPHYAQMLRDLGLRRELVRIGETIALGASSFEGDAGPEDQITDAEASLYALAERGGREGGFVDFAKAAALAVNTANAAYQRGGGLAGISSGMNELDEKLGGFRNSDLIILAGRPSMGKTALATNIAFNIARAYLKGDRPDGRVGAVKGGVVGFFSLEMSSEQLAARILAAESRLRSNKIMAGDIEAQDFEKFMTVAAELEEAPLYIDDTGALPIAKLSARARRLKRQHGLDILVIDYLQLVTASNSKASDNRVQEVSEITQGLKALAKELNIPIIALSQLSRKVEERDDKRPQLADLRESGSIEQDADVVMFVFREEYYHERMKPSEDDEKFPEWQQKAEKLYGRAEVIIGKQRHGPIGTVNLHFDSKFTKFSDPVRDESRYPPVSGGPGGPALDESDF